MLFQRYCRLAIKRPIHPAIQRVTPMITTCCFRADGHRLLTLRLIKNKPVDHKALYLRCHDFLKLPSKDVGYRGRTESGSQVQTQEKRGQFMMD